MSFTDIDKSFLLLGNAIMPLALSLMRGKATRAEIYRQIIGIEYIFSGVGEQTTLLRFSCGILILLFSQANSNEGVLVAINLQPRPDQA